MLGACGSVGGVLSVCLTGTQVFLEGSSSLQVASVELPAGIYLTTCLNEGLILMLFCGELF